MKQVRIYKTPAGIEPFNRWLSSIKDPTLNARIRTRLARLYLGNEGDHEAVGRGVYELRLMFGSGYRIYYAKSGEMIIVLLNGGDKKSQSKDIQLAQQYWAEFKGNYHE
ncbi:MAG: type II toxin-antitoxin system RelE/ParE family toxin [Gammaproteobacteria bacterium]|nr:type II toxin-antitoxin system RelE/ParE family toxin [Gammaproteobacteria bacterium]